MIAQLRGSIVESNDGAVILDVGGVGYALTVSGKTQAQLALCDPAVVLLTEMIVREDSMTLYGFLDTTERDAFRLLTTVQGVGAKAALSILSVLTPGDLSSAIMAGDKAMVTRADGVGPKLALRVVNELAEKIGKLPSSGGGLMAHSTGVAGGDGGALGGVDTAIADAMSALLNLGYGRAEAHGALLRARQKSADEKAGETADGAANTGPSVSALIAGALQEMGS
jgi:Holliday junction DNA helicase RuvA